MREFYGNYRGEVVQVDDPKKANRIRVNVFGIYDGIPTDHLPWAIYADSFMGGGFNRGGAFVPDLGNHVWVFFEQGDPRQPVYWAGAPSALDGPTEATPLNRVFKTKAGHLIEIDDEPNATRIRIEHKSGSFQEYTELGDVQEHVEKDLDIRVKGNVTIQVDGNVTGSVDGNVTASIGKNLVASVAQNATTSVGGDLSATVTGNADVSIDGSATVTVQGPISVTAGGNVTADVTGTLTVNSGGNVTVNAPETTVNGTVNVNGIANISQDAIIGGISFLGHKHGGVESGGAETSTPT